MRKRLALLAASAFVATAASFGSAQAVPPIVHTANLNWDVVNTTGGAVDDFEIIVENPNWVPPQIYTGGLGFPQSQVVHGDFDPAHPGGETKIRWSGRTFDSNAVAHVGAYMYESGLILDAYFTLGGSKVGPSVGLPYELTFVTPPGTGVPGRLNMGLRSNEGFVRDNPGNGLRLANIRTFANIPAEVLALDDLNEMLDLQALSRYETAPDPTTANLTIDSFFDVFVTLDPMIGPSWESLLVGDLQRVLPTGGTAPIGRFWNLNAQCPEPGVVGIGALAIGVMLRRRH